MKGYANAKINLALQVKGRNNDGYHELDMIMAPIDLYDTITINVIDDQYETIIEFDDYSIPTENTVSKAVRLMRERYRFKEELEIIIQKKIPSEAGLGGGSADAAFVIRALNDILKLNISEQELIAVAKEVGADVPFFLINQIARVQGIGEKITPLIMKNKPSLLLIKPFKGCSTKKVFQNYDLNPITEHPDLQIGIDKLEQGDYSHIEHYLTNELLVAANQECGDIQRIISQLKIAGFTWIGMSGSGSTVFVLSDNEDELIKAAEHYKTKGYYVVLSSII